MAQILKVSTAYTFRIGPFVSSSDGFTPQTSLTIAYTDCLLSKAGGAFAAKADTTNLTSTGTTQGYYTCVLNTTDTNTTGPLRVHIYVSGALPVWRDFQVVNAVTYDSLFSTAGADYLQVDLAQIGGSAVATGTAQLGVNVVNVGGSAVSATAGLLNANVTQLSGDATAADNAEAFFDGTGYAGTNNVIPTVTAVTNQVTANMTAISGDTVAADNLESYCDGTTPQPVNVTTWLGTAAATPTTAGVPEVDITHIAGAAVSTTTAQIGANIVQVIGDPIVASSSKTTNWGGTP